MTKHQLALLLLVVLWLVAPSLTGQGSDLDPGRIRMAESATDKGNAFLKKENYERAEGEFIRAIEHEARYPAAHLGLGAVMVATGRHQEALDTLREAERRFADWQRMSEVAGLKNRQHFADREREFQDVSRLAGRSGAGGGTVNAQEVAQEVAMDRHIADRLRPEEVEGIPAQVFYLEGLALLRLGRRDAGIDALETCLYVDDSHALSHYNLAVAQFTGGELALASQHLTAAMENGAQPHPQFVADLNAALEQAGMEVVE